MPACVDNWVRLLNALRLVWIRKQPCYIWSGFSKEGCIYYMIENTCFATHSVHCRRRQGDTQRRSASITLLLLKIDWCAILFLSRTWNDQTPTTKPFSMVQLTPFPYVYSSFPYFYSSFPFPPPRKKDRDVSLLFLVFMTGNRISYKTPSHSWFRTTSAQPQSPSNDPESTLRKVHESGAAARSYSSTFFGCRRLLTLALL